MPPEALQEVSWELFFANPTHWWSKPTRQHSDFGHKKSKIALWLDNGQKPAWVDSQLSKWDAVKMKPPESVSNSVSEQGDLTGRLEVRVCMKLCEDGRISEAVVAANLLVKQGLHVDKKLFYRVLKWCIAHKDLALGRQIHSLTIKSGYEGNAFLATHLMGLYASHGRLEEVMEVFTKVPSPDAYNWATIIFAYARHGGAVEAAQAIQLYRQMRESNVRPDNRIYSAVLKGCAAAGNLVAGKEVHAHILASPGNPDIFVQNGLVYMYAKCRSLEEARRLFDRLPVRNVVTWTAMISGYAQQGMGQEAISLYRTMQKEGISPPDSVTYICLLQACASVGVGALHEGKQVHAEIKDRGLQEDVVLGGSLINMYAKCGSLGDARSVFDILPARNVITCTTMIAGYAQQGMGQEALSLYRRMQQEALSCPDSVTYVCLLQACASVGVEALLQGKQLHAQIEETGLQDLILACSLVNMYAKCGSLEGARTVFDRLSAKNIAVWNAILAAYAKQGMGEETLSLYRSMQLEGSCNPDSVTYVCLLQACASLGIGALHDGKQLHVAIKERGLQGHVVLGGSLVTMYVKCGSLEDARSVFDVLPARDVVTWTAMIAGYAQQGMGEEALSLYSSMQQEGLTPDVVTFVCLLQACASVGAGALHEGKQLHAQIEECGLQDNAVVGGSMVNMYARCGSLEDAQRVFDRLPKKTSVAWNSMLAGYAQQGMGHEALSFYRSMQQEDLSPPSCATYVCLLQACANVGLCALHQGKQLHAEIQEVGLQDDVVLGGSLVNMYAKCGSLEDARSVFDILPDRNVVTWTAMIAGYAQQGMGLEAIGVYRMMQQEGLSCPDPVAYVCLLQACASVGVGALLEGKRLHAEIQEKGLRDDIVLACSLVNMYAKCGSLEDARHLFDILPVKNVVTWTAMIAGYAQQGMSEEALSLYRSMQQEGISPPDSVTYVCLLQACAFVAALPLGKQLHAQVQERGLQADPGVGAAVVNMYAKCGSMLDSQQVFDALHERTMEAWNALIGGYTRQGDSEVVFDLLDKMRQGGIQPDGITILSVLTVCSHVGLVDKGREYFQAMRTDYDIHASIEHFTCMIDLLGRAGYLEDALQMAKTMPFPPNDVVWHTLLGACWKWKNVAIGQQAFEGAMSIDKNDAASCVLMSNIYASAKMWDAAIEMQARRKKLGAWKKPGQSWWTDMGGVVHTFVVGDKTHPESEGIYARLEQLFPKMKKEGYVPHLHSSLRDTSDDEKEAELCGHSEKLAIAHALNRTPEGTTIRIVKNLRVCTDCHTATAYISKVEKRTIICRDASRFHVYKGGECSCGDYW